MILPSILLHRPPGGVKDVATVLGVLTLLVGGVAQAFHDDRVVELRVQLRVEEVDGERTRRNGYDLLRPVLLGPSPT